jgi:hypothetical protein
MTLEEQEPSVGKENPIRAHVNNIDLVGAIHVVKTKQSEIDA